MNELTAACFYAMTAMTLDRCRAVIFSQLVSKPQFIQCLKVLELDVKSLRPLKLLENSSCYVKVLEMSLNFEQC